MRQAKPRPTPKKKKSNKVKTWLVCTKGDYINAAIDDHETTEKRLIKAGWKIIGCPSFKDKSDAIDWIEGCRGEKYKRGMPPK